MAYNMVGMTDVYSVEMMEDVMDFHMALYLGNFVVEVMVELMAWILVGEMVENSVIFSAEKRASEMECLTDVR